MKKIYIFMLSVFVSTSIMLHAQKVETIIDEFYDTKYYQSQAFVIAKNPNYWIEARVRTENGTTNIFVEVAVGSRSNSVFTSSDNDKIRLKFKDGTILALDYEKSISMAGQAFGYMGSAGNTMRAKTKIKTIGDVTMIRIETSNGFSNFKVTETDAKKLTDSFNNVKKALEDNTTQTK